MIACWLLERPVAQVEGKQDLAQANPHPDGMPEPGSSSGDPEDHQENNRRPEPFGKQKQRYVWDAVFGDVIQLHEPSSDGVQFELLETLGIADRQDHVVKGNRSDDGKIGKQQGVGNSADDRAMRQQGAKVLLLRHLALCMRRREMLVLRLKLRLKGVVHDLESS